jgi:hypothetical protein
MCIQPKYYVWHKNSRQIYWIVAVMPKVYFSAAHATAVLHAQIATTSRALGIYIYYWFGK